MSFIRHCKWIKAAAALLFTLCFAVPAFSYNNAENYTGIYREVFNREYRNTDEGRQQLVSAMKKLSLERGMLKYFNEFGITVSSVQEFTNISDDFPWFKGLNDAVGKFGLAISTAGLIFDLASGTGKDVVVMKGYMIVLGKILGDLGFGPISASLAAAQFLMEKAGGAVYKDYEQNWYAVYRKYHTIGDGKLKYVQWADKLQKKTYQSHLDNFWSHPMLMSIYRDYHGNKGKGVVSDTLVVSDKSYREKFAARFFKEELSDSVMNIFRVRALRAARQRFEEIQQELERLSRIGKLNVTVADLVTSDPVKDAEITAYIGPDRIERKADWPTSSRGEATIRIPPAAEIMLEVSCKDYETSEQDLGLLTFSKNFSGNPQPINGTVFLKPLVTDTDLSVTVQDSLDGSPVDGAAVSARVGGSSEVGTTSGGGSVMLNVRPGSASISVSKDGYASKTVSVKVSKQGSSKTVKLEPNLITGTLTVSVKDMKSRKPVVGASVQATVGDKSVTKATKGGKAVFQFQQIRDNQSVDISVTKPGYASGTSSAAFENGKAAASVDIESKGAVLRVAVRDKENDQPLFGVTIQVAGVEGTETTDEAGRAIMTISPQSPVQLTISKPGYKTRTAEREIKDGVAKAGLYLFKKGAVLTVKVGDKSTRQPLSDVRVKAIVEGVSKSALTGGDGMLILGIPDGKSVTISLSKKGYKTASATKPIVEGKAFASGTLKLTAGAFLLIRLKDKGTKDPISGATVTAGEKTGTTNAEGACTLEVPSGKTVQVTAEAKGYTTRSASGETPKSGETKAIGWYLVREVVIGSYRGEFSKSTPIPGGHLSMSGEFFISVDSETGRFTASFAGRGKGKIQGGRLDISHYDEKTGKKTKVEEVTADYKIITFRIGSNSGGGTYDASTGQLKGRMIMTFSLTSAKAQYDGKMHQLDLRKARAKSPLPDQIPQVIIGEIMNHNGSGIVADNANDPGAMQWTISGGVMTIVW